MENHRMDFLVQTKRESIDAAVVKYSSEKSVGSPLLLRGLCFVEFLQSREEYHAIFNNRGNGEALYIKGLTLLLLSKLFSVLYLLRYHS